MALINEAQCRQWLLAYAERARAHRFKRVSMEGVKDRLEERLRREMRSIVDEQPSVGMTIRV